MAKSAGFPTVKVAAAVLVKAGAAGLSGTGAGLVPHAASADRRPAAASAGAACVRRSQPP
jgi:hypothetical protein